MLCLVPENLAYWKFFTCHFKHKVITLKPFNVASHRTLKLFCLHPMHPCEVKVEHNLLTSYLIYQATYVYQIVHGRKYTKNYWNLQTFRGIIHEKRWRHCCRHLLGELWVFNCDEGEFALYSLPSATHNYTRHFGNKVLNQDYSKTETIVNCR